MILILDLGTFNVVGAECGRPAEKGPHALRKHVGGSLSFTLEEYSRLEKCPEYLTCTDKVQEWNKPRQRKLDSLLVILKGSRFWKRKIVRPMLPLILDHQNITNSTKMQKRDYCSRLDCQFRNT